MLTTTQLNELWLNLSSSPEVLKELRQELEVIYARPDYQTWHQSTPKQQFEIQGSRGRLMELGLIANSTLQVKINRIGERTFITDGAWVESAFRVFPDPDEALVLLKHVEETKLNQWADWVVDPAAGSGHTPLGFNGIAKRLSCDVNVRALLYASINGAMNGLSTNEFFPVLNNMRMGLPEALSLRGNILFLTNVPFAPAPRNGLLAINAAGGETGAELQVASFKLVKQFADFNRVPVRACFLTWTVGSMSKDEWEVPMLCREVFPDAKIKWLPVDDRYDSPELANPAGLRESLKYLALSQYAVENEQEKLLKEYSDLADSLEAQGYTHMSYGLLDCDLSPHSYPDLN